MGNSVPELIRDVFARLAEDRNHGRPLVSRSLAFLAASRNGLAEAELLDLLSGDDEVVRASRQRSPRSPRTDRLPDIAWSRLFSDLAPYLNERQADGRTLLGFYHRQLADVATDDYLVGDEAKARHAALAGYFAGQALETLGPSGPMPNLRRLSELPFQQTHAELWDELFSTLTDFEFLERKSSSFDADERFGPNDEVTRTYPGVFLLQDDYELALRHWPSDELPRPQPVEDPHVARRVTARHPARVARHSESGESCVAGEERV